MGGKADEPVVRVEAVRPSVDLAEAEREGYGGRGGDAWDEGRIFWRA